MAYGYNGEIEKRSCLVCELSFRWVNPEHIVCGKCQDSWAIDCYGNYDLDKMRQREELIKIREQLQSYKNQMIKKGSKKT